VCEIKALTELIKRKEHFAALQLCNGTEMPCFIEYGDEVYENSLSYEEYLYIYIDYKEVIIGPFFSNTHIGCPSCFKERRRWNKREYEYRENPINSMILGSIHLNIPVLNKLIETLWYRYLDKSNKNLMYYSMDQDNNVKLNYYWPTNSCKDCSKNGIEDDTLLMKEAFSQDIYLDKYNSYYSPQNYSSLNELLSSKNTDSNFFIYKDYSVDKFFSVTSYFRLKNKDYYGMGIGSGTNLQTTLYHSIFEAFERYGGMHPRGRESVIISASYEELSLKKPVMDPNIFLKDVQGKNSKLIQYDANIKTNWIKSFSWKNKKAYYIPESLAYYKFDDEYSGNDCMVFKGCSNGNALGSTILDSIYYACMELIERDAFLNHWYLKRSPKKIDLRSIEDETINTLIRKLENLGYKVSLYDIRIEETIPTVWAFCEGEGIKQFATYSTAAANHNPVSAISAALHEMLLALEYYSPEIEGIKEKAVDIKKVGVKELTDHPILYSLESEKYLFKFLTEIKESYTIQNLYEEYFNRRLDEKINLKIIVGQLLDRLSSRFGDVFIVRQTPFGYKDVNLELVKVLIPNIQQLWFGEDNRMICYERIQALRKLWHCEYAEVNMEPHPFP
jgi:thiazole/oxazole-forming peptide maturase SagD family component